MRIKSSIGNKQLPILPCINILTKAIGYEGANDGANPADPAVLSHRLSGKARRKVKKHKTTDEAPMR